MKSNPRIVDLKSARPDELHEYSMQMLVWDASELSVVLRGHLLVEQVVEALIARRMPFPERFFGAGWVSFETKVDLASALAVLPDAHAAAARALDGLRRRYNPRQEQAIRPDELNALKIGWSTTQRKTYAAAFDKGMDEAVRIAVIFLNWSFLELLPQEARAA